VYNILRAKARFNITKIDMVYLFDEIDPVDGEEEVTDEDVADDDDEEEEAEDAE